MRLSRFWSDLDLRFFTELYFDIFGCIKFSVVECKVNIKIKHINQYCLPIAYFLNPLNGLNLPELIVY